MMDRRIVNMRHKRFDFPPCSFKKELCFALLCPDKTHEKDLKHRMP